MRPHYFMANRRGKCGRSDRFLLLGLQNHCGLWLQPSNQKTIASWGKVMTNLNSVEKQRHYSAHKDPNSQGYGLPCGHVQLWKLGRKEDRTPKIWCFWTVVLEKTPESPLDNKEIKPVNFKGDQPWIFTGRTDAETEALIFCSSDVNRQLIGKVPDAGKDGGQKEKRILEDEMAAWHHWRNEYELGQTLGDGEGQGGLVCCSPWLKRVGHNWVTEQEQNLEFYILQNVSLKNRWESLPMKWLSTLGKYLTHWRRRPIIAYTGEMLWQFFPALFLLWAS